MGGDEKDVAGGGIGPSSGRWLPWKEERGSWAGWEFKAEWVAQEEPSQVPQSSPTPLVRKRGEIDWQGQLF